MCIERQTEKCLEKVGRKGQEVRKTNSSGSECTEESSFVANEIVIGG